MKYKLRYTLMAFMLCGLLGVDLAYEYQKSTPVSVATPHPVVRSIRHLIAPATPPASTAPTGATSTATSTATTTATTSTPMIEATTTQASSTKPTQKTIPTATSTNRFRRNLRLP